MFFQPWVVKHPAFVQQNAYPPALQSYHIPGAECRWIMGDFGTLIGQLIPNDQYTVSLHHFFLETFTYVQFPFDTIHPVLLYNHESVLTFRLEIGKERVPIGPGDFQPHSFHFLNGLHQPYPLSIRKGNYTFFMIDASSLELQTILNNVVLRDIYMKALKDYLRGIARRVGK